VIIAGNDHPQARRARTRPVPGRPCGGCLHVDLPQLPAVRDARGRPAGHDSGKARYAPLWSFIP